MNKNQKADYTAVQRELEKARECHRNGQIQEAEKRYRSLMEEHKNGDAAAALGVLLKSCGRTDGLTEYYRKSLAEYEWTPLLINNSTNWLRENGLNGEGLQIIRKALLIWPRDLSLRWGEILSLHNEKKYLVALSKIDELIEEVGERPKLMQEKIFCLIARGMLKEALIQTNKLQNKHQCDESIRIQRLILLQRLGRSTEAWEELKHQTELRGSKLKRIKAEMLLKENKYEKAEKLFQQLIHEDAKNGDDWINLAACKKALRKNLQTLQVLEKGAELHPTRTDITQGLGSKLLEFGEVEKGLALLRESIKSETSTDIQYANFQFSLAANNIASIQESIDEAITWEKKRGLKPTNIWSDHIKEWNTNEKIKIAYFSQDFNDHPVGRFIEPLIASHNRKRFEITGINAGIICDDQTIELKKLCDKWIDISQQTDMEAARSIAEVGPDIIIELGGYTGGQRIRVLTARPAPIQLSYLGYFAATHLSCIDGWIGDNEIFPTGFEKNSPKQKLYRIDRCYMAHKKLPEVDLKRTAEKNEFRFGSFNHSRKLSDKTLTLFATVLNANPKSKLVLKSQSLGKKEDKENLLLRLIDKGIHEERIIILDRCKTYEEHLWCYGKVDICLDTIPYGGATTTLEALWMGVPVISLRGKNMIGRLSSSILVGGNCSEYIANTQKEYVQISTRCSSKGIRCTEQRRELRKIIEQSSLMDGKTLARSIEEIYEQCWRQFMENEE